MARLTKDERTVSYMAKLGRGVGYSVPIALLLDDLDAADEEIRILRECIKKASHIDHVQTKEIERLRKEASKGD